MTNIQGTAHTTLTINMSFTVSLEDPNQALEKLKKLAQALITTLPLESTESILEEIYEAMNFISEK